MTMPKKAPPSPAARLRETKRELAAMRARYFHLYDLAPAGLFTLSEDGVILEANLAVAALLGAQKAALLKRPLSGFAHPDDRGWFTALARKFSSRVRQPTVELRMLRGGAPFWARLDLTMGHDASGDLLFRVAMTDVTERVQAQADLLRLRAAFDHAHDGIAVADMDGRLQFVNRAWTKMHGYEGDELIGKPLSISHTRRQLAEDVIPFNKKVLAHGSWSGEVGHVRKNGETFLTWMSTALLLGADGEPTGLVGMADDITERRKAAAYLASVLSEREAILKAIPDLFYRLDADLRLQDWNLPFEILSGYPPDRLKGMHSSEFFKTDRVIIAEGIQEAIAKGQAYRTGRLLTRAGEEIPVFWSAAALRGPEGAFLGLVGIGRDLTVK